MSKYYNIRKLKDLNDKLYHFIPQRRNSGIIIELKRKKGIFKKMDNKYQNLHIFWRGYRFRDMEHIEIKQIIFKDKMIVIDYVDSENEDKRLLLIKRNYSIKID